MKKKLGCLAEQIVEDCAMKRPSLLLNGKPVTPLTTYRAPWRERVSVTLDTLECVCV